MGEDESLAREWVGSREPPENLKNWADVRLKLENSCPSLSDLVDIESYLQDSQHWAGMYAVPNCPEDLSPNTAIAAYNCAVRRSGSVKLGVKHTKALDKKLTAFADKFRSLGGVSLYHWAFSRVYSMRHFVPFQYAKKSNTGVGIVFDINLLTPRYMSGMFRRFPTRSVVCLRPCDAVIAYRVKKQRVIAEAMSQVMQTSLVEAGISHVEAELTKEELLRLATAWRQTAYAVEASFASRIEAGDDIWLGIFPGLE